jgi:Family of unknown function (DUF6368)
MAGPVIQLRATKFDKSDEEKMLTLLSRIAIIDETRDNYFDFRFKKGKIFGLKLTENSCPFLLDISTKKEALDDLQKADFDAKIKDNPAAFLSVSAMCKSPNDHHLLASLVDLLILMAKFRRLWCLIKMVNSLKKLTKKP